MNKFDPLKQLKEQSSVDSLAFELTLKINGASHKIPGANVKQCQLSLVSYGFSGSVGFWLPVEQNKDQLIDNFATEDLIEIDLSITPVFNLPEPPPEPLVVKGLVTDKSVIELNYLTLSERPILYRYYRVTFADPAAVLWRQHFPCELYVDQTMASVIKAQIPELIKLDLELTSLNEAKPIICLGLGKRGDVNVGSNNIQKKIDKNITAARSTSFYDFLIEYLQNNNGVLSYDYAQQKYLLSDDKPELTETKIFLPHEIFSLSSFWPETARNNTQLLNALADNPQQELIEQTQAVSGVRQDKLFRCPITSEFSAKKQIETDQLVSHGECVSVKFSQWPLQSFYPNIGFKVNNEVWGTTALYANKDYRVYQININIEAVAQNHEEDIDTEFTQYQLNYDVLAEQSASLKKRFPDYYSTRFPLLVEGKIVSTIGEEGKDKTYDIVENKDSGQYEYQVYIPLWDKNIKILFEPDFLNSHFYFPFYRDNKVLVAFDCYQASIVKVLSWGDRVRLPVATQGNHILFGKNDQDETSLRHIYEASKPVLDIKRKKEKDTELVRLEEGSIILQTCEEK
ncbi:hypothetical protein [Aliikangiella coralliicola]|uniref:Uncharacterized protein n=1 Tax=Aliikangiella coralliicola TaxID=2592383 RepID=A0A545UG90_9GAMM|nr:hypothetical protein [Aliikangiella coralliicola]TQV88492.1 hypothetical protein FLL46_08180 [Aliikangiella coralliicola]